MERSGNLRQPVYPILLNSIDSTKANLFYDSVAGKAKMIFPEVGTTIPIDSNTTIGVSLPKKGRNKLVVLTPDPIAPCEECDFEFGVQIRLYREQPGVDNDDKVPIFSHNYSKIAKLGTIAGGELSDDDQEKMITDIVTYMGKDDLLTQYCTVGTVYKVLQADNGNIIITNSAGVNKTITGDEPSTMQAEAINDEGLSTKIIPYAADDVAGSAATWDYFLLVPHTETLVSVDGSAVDPYGLFVESKNQLIEPVVLFDESQYINASFSYAWIPVFSAALNHRVIINGEYDDVTAVAPEAAATELEGEITGYAVGSGDTYVTGADGEGMILYDAKNNIDVIPLASAVSLTPVTSGIDIQWPGLTADKVFKIFSQMRHLGEFESLVRTNKPSDVDFVKVNIVHSGHVQASMHGASQGGYAEQRCVVYMPKTVFETAIYDAADINDASGETGLIATGTDNSFGALLRACVDSSDSMKAVAEGGWTSFVKAWADS